MPFMGGPTFPTHESQIQDGGRSQSWKNRKLAYLHRSSSDFDEIWHGDADWPSWPFGLLQIWNVKSSRWRWPPSWKIQKSRYFGNGLTDLHTWHERILASSRNCELLNIQDWLLIDCLIKNWGQCQQNIFFCPCKRNSRGLLGILYWRIFFRMHIRVLFIYLQINDRRTWGSLNRHWYCRVHNTKNTKKEKRKTKEMT